MRDGGLRPWCCYVYLDDEPVGTGVVRADGKIDMVLPVRDKRELDGRRLRFLQADPHDRADFDREQGEGDLEECELCGGEGVREYEDAPDEWGEDCPSEPNHLIPCRGCVEIARDRERAFAAWLLRRHLEACG